MSNQQNDTFNDAVCEQARELGLIPEEYETLESLQKAIDAVELVECPRCHRGVIEDDLRRGLCSNCENAVYDAANGN